MPRSRVIKPDFFRSESVGMLSLRGRLLFAGLWTLADGDGRLLDRPRRIEVDLFPYDGDTKIDLELGSLAAKRLIIRYRADNLNIIQITNWEEHQHIHKDEPRGLLPPPPDATVGSSRDGSTDAAALGAQTSEPPEPQDAVGDSGCFSDDSTKVEDDETHSVGQNLGLPGFLRTTLPLSSSPDPDPDPPIAPQGGERATYHAEFEAIWQHPRRIGTKERAFRAWKKAGKPAADGVIRHWEAWAKTGQWRDGFIPHLSTWINGRGYAEMPSPEMLAPRPGGRHAAGAPQLSRHAEAEARIAARFAR